MRLKKQVLQGNGLGIVIIHFVRKKSRVAFDSFWGHANQNSLQDTSLKR